MPNPNQFPPPPFGPTLYPTAIYDVTQPGPWLGAALPAASVPLNAGGFDSQPAIQNTLLWAAQWGGVVYIPSGVYLLQNPLLMRGNNVGLIGQAAGTNNGLGFPPGAAPNSGTVLQFVNTVAPINGAAITMFPPVAGFGQGGFIEDLTIVPFPWKQPNLAAPTLVNNRALTSIGILMPQSADCAVRRVDIYGMGVGVLATGAATQRNTFEFMSVQGCAVGLALVGIAGGVHHDGTRILNCDFDSIGIGPEPEHPLVIGPVPGAVGIVLIGDAVGGVLIDNCRVRGFSIGVAIWAAFFPGFATGQPTFNRNVIVSNLIADDNYQSVVCQSVDRVRVSGSSLRLGGSVFDNTDGCSVENCDIVGLDDLTANSPGVTDFEAYYLAAPFRQTVGIWVSGSTRLRIVGTNFSGLATGVLLGPIQPQSGHTTLCAVASNTFRSNTVLFPNTFGAAGLVVGVRLVGVAPAQVVGIPPVIACNSIVGNTFEEPPFAVTVPQMIGSPFPALREWYAIYEDPFGAFPGVTPPLASPVLRNYIVDNNVLYVQNFGLGPPIGVLAVWPPTAGPVQAIFTSPQPPVYLSFFQ